MTDHIIDPLNDVDFSDDDIVDRCEMWINARFPAKRREILSRNLEAVRMGAMPALPEDKTAELQELQGVLFQAGTMADNARIDMTTKRGAWVIEQAMRDLAATPDDEEHAEARARLQATLDAADARVLALVSLRASAANPVVTQEENLPAPQEAVFVPG